MAPVPELTYFDIPGRGEIARLAFAAGGIEFRDRRIKPADWPALKGDPNSVPAQCFSSMPVIRHMPTESARCGSLLVAQSQAVAIYAAEQSGGLCQRLSSCPLVRNVQRSLDVMVLNAHADLQAAMLSCVNGSEQAQAEAKRQLAGKVAPILHGLEKLLERTGGPFLYSDDGPTLGDLAMYDAYASDRPGLKKFGIDVSLYPRVFATIHATATDSRLRQAKDGKTPDRLVVGGTCHRTNTALTPMAGLAAVQSAAGSKYQEAVKYAGSSIYVGLRSLWAATPLPELFYFNAYARGELPRLVFAAGGIAFKDTRISSEDWPTLKNDATMPWGKCFGSLPVLRHGSVLIAQSRAIATYAAGLPHSALAHRMIRDASARCHGLDQMALGAHADLLAAMLPCVLGDEASKASAKRGLQEKVASIMSGLDRLIERSGAGGPWLYATDGPTLGDLAIYDACMSPMPGLIALGVDIGQYRFIRTSIVATSSDPFVARYVGYREANKGK